MRLEKQEDECWTQALLGLFKRVGALPDIKGDGFSPSGGYGIYIAPFYLNFGITEMKCAHPVLSQCVTKEDITLYFQPETSDPNAEDGGRLGFDLQTRLNIAELNVSEDDLRYFNHPQRFLGVKNEACFNAADAVNYVLKQFCSYRRSLDLLMRVTDLQR